MEKFKILSIDGGGIKGLVPITLLAEWEREQRKENPKFRICDYFDMICGTSTGSIIALGLALGNDACDIQQLYIEKGSKIFKKCLRNWSSRSWWQYVCMFGKLLIGKSLYQRDYLKEELNRVMGNKTIGDCETRVCIPTYDAQNGKLNVLKTPHLSIYKENLHIPAVDAALSSSSAPVFFTPYNFSYMKNEELIHRHNMIDGGVAANNPALIGYIEAISAIRVRSENVEILSLGTTSHPFQMGTSNPCSTSLWFNLYEIMSSAQSIYIHNSMKVLSEGVGDVPSRVFKYVRIDEEVDKELSMDDTSEESISYLKGIGKKMFAQNSDRLNEFSKNKINKYKKYV